MKSQSFYLSSAIVAGLIFATLGLSGLVSAYSSRETSLGNAVVEDEEFVCILKTKALQQPKTVTQPTLNLTRQLSSKRLGLMQEIHQITELDLIASADTEAAMDYGAGSHGDGLAAALAGGSGIAAGCLSGRLPNRAGPAITK